MINLFLIYWLDARSAYAGI